MDKAIISKIKQKVEVNENGCWNWSGSPHKANGYARIMINGKRTLVHRLVMGDPDGKCVLHKCDNSRCVNPDHLYIGTHQDNMDDKVRNGRCASLKGEENPSAGMSEETAREVIRLLQKGVRQCKIVSELGLSYIQVHLIARGKSWKHLPRIK
jgi:hypothetical protein